jgi:aldose 1-epimerase
MGDAGKLIMVPITGTQHEISAGDYRATVTELGAGLRALHYLGRPVIGEYDPDVLPPGASGQLLAPWPNRVDGGRYAINGTRYQLDLSEPANLNAIHGLTRWAGWDVAARTSEAVVLRHVLLGRPGYPFCLEIEAEYRLAADSGLRVSITARNAGSTPAPYGTGSHPYLATGTPAIDDCQLTLPGGLWLPADERGIPSGPVQDVAGTPLDFRESRPIAGTRLDHALTGLTRDASGRAWARLSSGGTQPAGHEAAGTEAAGTEAAGTEAAGTEAAGIEVALWAGPGYQWLQVFTGDTLDPAHRRRMLAVEPMTCPPNAFASGMDLLLLEPGDSVTHTWGIQATVTG